MHQNGLDLQFLRQDLAIKLPNSDAAGLELLFLKSEWEAQVAEMCYMSVVTFVLSLVSFNKARI